MTAAKEGKRVVVCNYVEATKIASRGARAFVLSPNYGNAGDRVEVLVRSRGGRWLRKWEDGRRLGNFRAVTVVPAMGRVWREVFDLYDEGDHAEQLARYLNGPIWDGRELTARRAQPELNAEALQRARRR